MAIQTSDLLLKLNPLGGLASSPEGPSSMERERMRLLREQFEETKRQNALDNQYRQLHEQGEMARAQLGLQKQREQAEALAAAELTKNKQDIFKKFSELNGSGDIEGARALVPYMTSLGMQVDLEGEDAGLPRYRIAMDEKAANQQESARAAQTSSYGPGETAEQSLSRLGGMGYPEGDSGVMSEPAGIGGEEALGRAQAASDYAELSGRPARAPDAPDYTGAVPRDVIDTGAIAGQTAARLNPALSGLIGGLPEEYQGSAQSTASGIAGLGLPAAKALELYGKQQGDANTLITGRLNAEEKRQQDEAQRQQFQQRAEMARGKNEFSKYNTAFNDMGKEIASKYDVEARKRAEVTHQDVLTLLNNHVKEDDLLALSYLSRLFGERGATSNADAARALGLPATSTWDQIVGWVTNKLEGGIPEPNRSALIGVIKRGIKSNDAELEKYSNRMLELVKDPETDPEVSKGLYDYWRATVPDKIRAAHEEKRQTAGGQPDRGTSGAATPADGNELDYALDLEASAAGLNTDAIRRVIQLESGGKPGAVNAQSGATGLIQFMPETAKALGTTTEELASMPVEDQVRFVVKYFENAGLDENSSPDDYALAVAAPAFVGKPDSTVVYPKGSKAWEQNVPWRPADGGDITVGSIKAAYGSKGGTKSRAERIAELRRKAAEP